MSGGAGLLLGLSLALAPQAEQRVAVVSEAICRDAPGRAGTAVGSFELGETMHVKERRHLADGTEPWLLVGSGYLRGSCWVLENLTEPFDRESPERALLAMADRVLESARNRPFDDFVRVENLFRDPPWWVELDSLPELSLARLDLIDAAASAAPRRELEKDPLKVSWILSHGSVLAHDEPSGAWLVGRGAYWELHERFEGSDFAEELAWRAASRPRMGECEGFAECTVRAILDTVAEYWIRYPDGVHLPDAVEVAQRWTEATLENCENGFGAEGFSVRATEDVRMSLAEVSPDVKRPLLDDLERIDERCGTQAPGDRP